MRRIWGLVALAALLTGSLVVVKPSLADDLGVTVAVRDDRFTDSRLTVPAGTTVTWEHKGNNTHTIAALDESFDSGLMERGQSFSHTFDAPGVYQYLCRQHLLQGMRGTITVE